MPAALRCAGFAEVVYGLPIRHGRTEKCSFKQLFGLTFSELRFLSVDTTPCVFADGFAEAGAKGSVAGEMWLV